MSLLPYTAGVYRTASRAVSWFARAFPPAYDDVY